MSVSLIRRHSPGYNFVGDRRTGMTFRWGSKPEENPNVAPWPEMADISVTNRCEEGCAYCYRDSRPDGRDLRLEEYALLLRQLRSRTFGNVFQVALGGGEPLLHPDFIRILEMTREAGVVPNYTTNGRHFTPEIIRATAEHCGAVAVSHDPTRAYPEPGELHRIGRELAEAGIKANIHWVLSCWSLPQAMQLLEGNRDELFEPFNAILFLAYKPAGRASTAGLLQAGPELDHFLDLLALPRPAGIPKMGVDACLSPLLLRRDDVDATFLDACEAGRFSIYVDEDLNVMPCSFCNRPEFSFNLRKYSFARIWEKELAAYRTGLRPNTCPFYPQLQLRAGSPNSS